MLFSTYVSSVGDFCGLVTGDDFSVAVSPSLLLSLLAPTKSPKSPLPLFLTGLISESCCSLELKLAQPSADLGPGEDSKGLSKGTVVEAARGLESHGLPMSIATSVPDPDSITSVEFSR